MGRVTVRRQVLRISGGTARVRPDALAAEEPLEQRVNGRALAVTMRTPGSDVELAHGFLLTEGVIAHREDVAIARYCDGVDDQGRNTYNVLDIALADGVAPPETGVERNFYTTSSCGVCGKAALDAVRLRTRHSPADDALRISADTLSALPPALRAAQRVFDSTGGLHAAGLFTADGTLLAVREDVGRHNAVDKVIGWALLADRVPLSGCVLMVSGRASFELVQKAAMAGIPLLAAVSAPSSLAVDLADEQGMTLVGFLRGDSMNVYTGRERVIVDSAESPAQPVNATHGTPAAAPVALSPATPSSR
ncbi:formate dehydrogenase accessory sulfurtransferase FdhD [Actinoalloteichus hymeniacidonis]|uniref:Sulfur carrier protein FdhD n=1 Tax=Actinoalloteichus hymeniacidonis TaxID=340345 RepID=A0AAC9MXM9_9PSEU|nr:formate dehydrogenase accessory sulfurtransferase FdhD [Actinoalloteichus hymeniacidonis]AOS62430.1 formate dehydrogenase family accessory protein FdhD [Actinoalloteichus hymeniacidonis]MBB5909539.1 FdhD protein [Actinoalloteichus hymeniacidonis]